MFLLKIFLMLGQVFTSFMISWLLDKSLMFSTHTNLISTGFIIYYPLYSTHIFLIFVDQCPTVACKWKNTLNKKTTANQEMTIKPKTPQKIKKTTAYLEAQQQINEHNSSNSSSSIEEALVEHHILTADCLQHMFVSLRHHREHCLH